MDYEDNDFQSQNFQLIGEDNDVFPQSLQLYTSSKFDIDDQFQGHLRFDNLSETGLLFGIQGEENDWIEEFSSRNSAVEIGPSIAQTCSISGHDHIWSSAPSSESAEMLVKSTGDDEMVSPQVMRTLEETSAMDDSANCGTRSILQTDSTLLSDKFHSSTSGSNVDELMASHHAGIPQSSSDEKSEIGLDVRSTDEKFHSTRMLVAMDNKELTPSGDVSKASLVVGELPEVVSTNDPLGSSYDGDYSLDHHGYILSRNSEAQPSFVSCSTKYDPLTENTGTVTGKLDDQFSSEKKMEECYEVDKSERSDALPSENGKNETAHCKVNDQNFSGNVYDLQSSHFVPPSLILSNEGSTKSVFLRNSDGDIDYQEKDSNESLRAGEERSSCMKEVPSLAVEKDGITGRHSLAVGNENFLELSETAEPLDLSNDGHANVLKDGLQLHVPLAIETESKMTRVDCHNVCRINPLSSKNSDLVLTEKGFEDEYSKGIAEISTAKFDASGLANFNGHSAALLDGAENNLPSFVHDKLSPISDTILLSAEIKEDIFSHSEKKECTAKLIYSDSTDSKDCDDIENPEIASFEAQNTNAVMKPDNKSIMDLTGVNSIIPQALQSEVEVILEQKEEAVSLVPIPEGSIMKDVNVSSLSAIEGNTDSHTSRPPQTVLDLDVGRFAIRNYSDGLETTNNEKVHVDLMGISPTCQSTIGKDATIASTNICDKLSSCGTKKNHCESSLLGADGGKQSSLEARCGSPTFISSNEHTLEEMTCGESSSSVPDPAVRVSDSTENSDNFTCNAKDSKVSSTSEDNENFMVVVQPAADLSKKDNKEGSEFCNLHSSKQLRMSKESSERCLDGIKPSTGTNSKKTEEKKGKEFSSHATRMGNVSQGDDKKSQEKHSKGRKKTQCASPIIGSVARDKDQCIYLETGTKNCSSSIQTSKMPDSNCSISSPFFNQPFTDLQQIQLRAQIFVYGSLIQGALPDEAFMVPAFGGIDGGRSLWERVWHASSERLHNQKLPPISCGTRLHFQSGISCSPPQSKIPNSTVVWSDSKLLNPTQNSIFSSKSPLHISFNNFPSSTFSRGSHLESKQSPSQLNSYQASQIQQGSSDATPLLSQSPNSASPFFLSQCNATPLVSQSPKPASSGFLSQSSPFASNAQYSVAPIAQTSQITPVRDTFILDASNMHLASPVALLPNQDAKNVSAPLFVPVEVQNKATTLASSENASVGEKSTKRTKISAGEDLVSKFADSQDQSESASIALITDHVPASVGLYSSSNSSSTVTSSGLVLTMSHPLTFPCHQINCGDTQQGVIFPKEILSQINHSKLEAENASAYAASAVRHSQVVWEQMANQRKLDLPSEVEQNLAFASVSAAAAASVAKVAAEVARIASEAALQAKLMADEALEALDTPNTWRSSQNCEIIPDSEKNLVTSASISICKGEDKIHRPSSIISIAREISRKRVETASAAIKRAENMDAIMRAAEMAAEAVSQAGSVVAMGDPLPFSINELIEAGHKGHWKLYHPTMGTGTETKDVQATENMALDVAGNIATIAKQQQVVSSGDEMSLNNEKSMLPEANYGGCELGSVATAIPTDIMVSDHVQGSIQKGSLVEVAVDEDGFRGAWFSAWVLDVKDGKAQVCYKDLVTEKGLEKLKEWIPLDSEMDKPPQIRMAHSVIVAKSEGRKKRRREVLGYCTWAIGDKVDAWIRNGWWEGIVTEKSEDDDSKLTIHFPAGGNSLTVRDWDLRHSLIWKDGQWIEWSHEKERVTVQSHEGDTPCEKRLRLGLLDAKKKPEVDETDGGTSSSNNHEDVSVKSRPLTGKDMIFSISEKNDTDTVKVRQADLNKNGSKMVCGVPKPGKKKKFMEVSKHYTKDKTGVETERSNSVQFAKDLTLQASKSKHTSKVYAQGKSATNLNSKGPKTLKCQNAQAKNTVDKEKLSVSDGGESSLRMTFSNEERSCTETDNSSHVVSSVQAATCALSVKNMSSVEAETVKKGKLLSGMFKSKRSEVGSSQNRGKSSADVIEPRRSNRKIRPTSKLLEGLQSAMIMSKKS